MILISASMNGTAQTKMLRKFLTAYAVSLDAVIGRVIFSVVVVINLV